MEECFCDLFMEGKKTEGVVLIFERKRFAVKKICMV